MDTKTTLFRYRIFLPGVVATVVLLTCLVVSVNQFQRYNAREQQAVSLKNTETFFKMKSDITAELASGRLLPGVLITVFVIFCVLGGLFFFLYVGRIDRKLTESREAMRIEIAERKKAEEKQAELVVQAQIANIAKSEFLANVNHEIRTPMNGILGFSELLESTNLDEEQLDYVRTIISSSRVLLAIINDILDTSKIEAGELVLKSMDFDLAGLVMEVCEILKPKINNEHIELICSVADGANNWFIGDPVRLRQVLINLVDNAIKFTSQGRIELSVKLLAEDLDQATLEISVQDTGIGIAPEKQQSVFGVFQQADGSITRKYGGIGLGLTISQQIVSHMNSRLNLQSEEGNGSRFYFVISLPKGAEQKAGSLSVDANKEPSVSIDQAKAQLQNRPLHILLAEDDAINQKLIVKIFSWPGCKLDIAVNGKEAIEMVKSHNYDIILMDVQMPVMDGIVATRAIRRMGLDLPIVALTANALDRDKQACLAAGMDEYIIKPVQSKEVYAVIQKFMSGRDKPMETVKRTQAQEIKDDAAGNHLKVADTQPIDIETLLEVCGDEEIAREMAGAICEDTPKVMATLLSAIQAEDCRNIRLYAHRLKGATATIGALSVSSQAAAIEEAARDNNIGQAKLLMERFQSDINKLLAFLGEVKWLETLQQTASVT
jgi:signal transduction histidine kinase/CheY-like chemotaxis protein/HPt (histidine-containing phosphotransfer) domain-containing protein